MDVTADLYQQKLAGASGRQKLNALQEVALGQVTRYGAYFGDSPPDQVELKLSQDVFFYKAKHH
jgi:hypothetical protein